MANNLPTATDEIQDPLENFEPKIYDDPLEQALAEETVATIKHEPFMCIPPNATVREAVETLASLHVACVLITEDEKLVGVITDRDFLDRAALEYETVANSPVSGIMTANPVFVYETDTAAAALCVMADVGYRHVPVLNSQREPVGIISPQRITCFLQQHVAT